ncbi:MAG: hypothetical protein IRZ08_21935, partial [Frankia sp.]|nr:hypothetical protein [Frankia sp.]
VGPHQRRGCHLDHADAIELAAVLHTWAWLPPRRAAERMAGVPSRPH